MFGLLSKKGRSEVGPVACFGKIPALGDFVRSPSPSEEMIAFETWLTRAMEAGEARLGPAFREAFGGGAAHAFLWSGAIDKKHRGLLAGVIVPSHDAVGRRFPLVVCAPLPLSALTGQPHLAPLVLAGFFQHAQVAAARALHAHTQPELLAQLASVASPSFEGASSAAARYVAWVRSQRSIDLWATLFGSSAEHASRYAIYALVEATASYRGQEIPPIPLGLRVPTGADPFAATALWLDLVRRAAGWKTTVPSFFLPLGVEHPRALVQLGAEAPPSVLGDLYVPSTDSEAVCELLPATDGRLPSVVPGPAARAADPSSMLSDLIDELSRV